MRKLPIDNAPSNMKPWVRDIVSIIKQHDATLYDNVNTQVATNADLNKSVLNINNTIADTNSKLSKLPLVACYGSGSINIVSINTPTTTIVTYSPALFTAGTTPSVTATFATGLASTGTLIPLNVTASSSTSFTIATQRSATGSLSFYWTAMGS
jgi:hypothetical protein